MALLSAFFCRHLDMKSAMDRLQRAGSLRVGAGFMGIMKMALQQTDSMQAGRQAGRHASVSGVSVH